MPFYALHGRHFVAGLPLSSAQAANLRGRFALGKAASVKEGGTPASPTVRCHIVNTRYGPRRVCERIPTARAVTTITARAPSMPPAPRTAPTPRPGVPTGPAPTVFDTAADRADAAAADAAVTAATMPTPVASSPPSASPATDEPPISYAPVDPQAGFRIPVWLYAVVGAGVGVLIIRAL